jgi:hypothetical protein
MLESQFQSIFFWFFLAGPLYLDRILINSDLTQAAVLPKVSRYSKIELIAKLGIVIVFTFLCLSPLNVTKEISVFSIQDKGEYPKPLHTPEAGNFADVMSNFNQFIEIKRGAQGFEVIPKGNNGEHSLLWILPDVKKIYRIQNIYDYTLCVDYVQAPSISPQFYFITPEYLTFVDTPLVKGQTLYMPLERMAELDVFKYTEDLKFILTVNPEPNYPLVIQRVYLMHTAGSGK